MLWFVNPHNAFQAVDLTKITSIEVRSNSIILDRVIWHFRSVSKAESVCEQIIKLVQQSRYRHSE